MYTTQQWTPTIQWTILKAPTVYTFTLILKQPLNGEQRTPPTPYNGQFSHSELYTHTNLTPIEWTLVVILSKINYPPLLLELITSHSTIRSLSCQCTARESSENIATLCSTAWLRSTTPTGNIYRKPLSSGHLAMRDKMLVPNGVLL